MSLTSHPICVFEPEGHPVIRGFQISPPSSIGSAGCAGSSKRSGVPKSSSSLTLQLSSPERETAPPPRYEEDSDDFFYDEDEDYDEVDCYNEAISATSGTSAPISIPTTHRKPFRRT